MACSGIYDFGLMDLTFPGKSASFSFYTIPLLECLLYNYTDSKRTITFLGYVALFVDCVAIVSVFRSSSLFNLLRFQMNVFEGDETIAVVSEDVVSTQLYCCSRNNIAFFARTY